MLCRGSHALIGCRKTIYHRLLGSRRRERLGGMTMKHFTAEEWVDFANGLVAVSQREEMDRHLREGCSRCKERLSLWQKVRQSAKAVAECPRPERAVRVGNEEVAAAR